MIDPVHVHLGGRTGDKGTNDDWTATPNCTPCSSMGKVSFSCRIRTRRRTTQCWPHSWSACRRSARSETGALGTSGDADLAALITEYFKTPIEPRWGGGKATPPRRLVFLPDHEYSRHGLSRGRLKGGDRL